VGSNPSSSAQKRIESTGWGVGLAGRRGRRVGFGLLDKPWGPRDGFDGSTRGSRVSACENHHGPKADVGAAPRGAEPGWAHESDDDEREVIPWSGSEKF
jgi:hypothetical protein